ncbi:MAG: alpha/beta fold hydrolase [Rubripirellula sp.]
MTDPASSKPIAIHALLVGINDWKFPDQIKSLRGCHNDVDLIESTLGRLFDPDTIRITKLHDQQATAAGIAEAFAEHLIRHAKQWHQENPDRPQDSPAFLFHFSGHGTQVSAPAGSKSSGLDETLCTYEMERGKSFGLRDWKLGELVDELTKYTDNATILLDCCHSGSGMRDIEDGLVARQVEPDLSPPPADLQPRARQSASRSTTDDGETGFRLAVSDRSVLLAACKSTQKAYEYTLKSESNEDRFHGAFTYSLSESLTHVYGNKVPTYDQLYRTTCRFVSYKSRSQRPQCEGGRERVLFGSQVKPRDLWMSVQNNSKGRYEVDGGLCHGITVGSELNVFNQDARQADQSEAKIGRLRVVESQAVRCFCEVMEPTDSSTEIPLDSPVSVSLIAPTDTTRTIRLSGKASEHQGSLAASTKHTLFRIADSGTADLFLDGSESGFTLKDAEGRLLDELPSGSGAEQLERMMIRWSRYFMALEIRNASVGPELANKIELNLLHAPSKTQADPFPTSEDGLLNVEDGEIARVEIVNRSRLPVYVTLLTFTSGGEVKMLYPSDAGRREQLTPDEPYRTGRYRLKISEDALLESSDTLKVIATKEETDFSLLCVSRDPEPASTDPGNHRSMGRSNKVPASLAGLLKQASSLSNDRDMEAIDDDEDDNWVTAELTYRLIRPISDTTVKVMGGQKQQIADSGIAVETPNGFNGQLSLVSNAQEAHRSLDGGSSPDWMRRMAALELQPAGISSSRSAALDQPWAIELNADPASLQAVTAGTPLKLTLPTHLVADESLTVIADHGGQPFVVGASENESGDAIVSWLPSLDAAAESSDSGSRGIGRSVKMYVMKKMGLGGPGLGLNVARFVPHDKLDSDPARLDERCVATPTGEVRYAPIGFANLDQARKALLLVHGFQSDSVWMMDQLRQLSGGRYDSVLTFDYETYNTGIGENAKLLADALKSAGLKADDALQVDVVSHSMGALVARGMIEMEGGHELVDRCLMLGPPNQGTELAKGMKLAMWASTLLVGGTLTAPWLARTLASALKGVVKDGNALRDLCPESEFLQKLNANDGRPIVPYDIVAGEQRISPDANAGYLGKAATVFWRGYAEALKFMFEDKHDMVVNVRSMATVRLGGDFDGRVTTNLVTADHFNYLADETTLPHMKNFVDTKN